MKNGLIEDNLGNKRWYVNDKLHRTDGPAIEFADGDKFWYLNDNDVPEHIVKWMNKI